MGSSPLENVKNKKKEKEIYNMSKWEKVMDNKIGGASSKAERVKKDRTFNRMMSFNKESDTAALKKEGDTEYAFGYDERYEYRRWDGNEVSHKKQGEGDQQIVKSKIHKFCYRRKKR